MKLYKIDIENFRGFSKLTIEDFKNLNLFVGKNNCGKTSLLEAIFLSIGVSNPNLALSIDRFRGLLHDEKEDFRFIFHKLDYKKRIQIKTEFTNDTQYRKLIIKPTLEDTIKDVDLNTDLNSSTFFSDKNIDGIEFDFSIKTKLQSKGNSYKSVLKLTNKGLKARMPGNYKEELLGVFIRPTISSGELYDRLDKILINKDQSQFIKSLHYIDNKIVNISIGAKNMVYFDIGIDRLVPIHIMGDGIIKLLNILATIAFSKNGIVVIDEIDNGFHYSIFPKLWSVINITAKQFNVQIFATTHSYECVKSFSETCSNELLKEDCLRLYRIEKIDGEFKSVKYDSEILDSSFESNWEIR